MSTDIHRLRRERDIAVTAADRLAGAIGDLLGMDFSDGAGPHPWIAAAAAAKQAAEADRRGHTRQEVHAETAELIDALISEWRGPGPRAPHGSAHLTPELGRVTFHVRGFPLQLAYIVDALRAYRPEPRPKPAYTVTPARGPGSVYREDV